MEEEYFKIFKESDKHHGFQYHDGVNVDDKFNEKPECGNGMFFTAEENIHIFYDYGALKYSKYSMDYASENGHIDTLKWWKENVNELKYSNFFMDYASENGHIDTLKWWLKEGGLELKYTVNAMDWASENNHVDVVKWWKESGLLNEK
jgi:ankyrin repeat protein